MLDSKINIVLLSLIATSPATADEPRRHPNVLLIMTDDQGWGDLSCHGNEILRTPVIDSLAEQGVQFDRFYVSPVCAPTRASLLTGRYHLRTGVTGVTRGQETVRADEVTIAELFQRAGYRTGCFGKWHSGAHFPHHPRGQGFRDFLGFCGGHWNDYFDTTLEHNGRPVKTRGYITDVITDAAVDFIEQNQGEPFFCYVPFNAPHGPFQVPDHYFDKYKNLVRDQKTAAVYAMCENIDDNVGRLLATLERNGLERDTIVLFLTDNGPNGARYNGGMRGTKGSAHEGGVRVPLFVRWPGKLKAGHTVKEIAAHIDLLPTLCDLCGVKATGTKPLDGISLAPVMRDEGSTDTFAARTLFSHWGNNRSGTVSMRKGAVRTSRFRLVTEKGGYELYDMLADPQQKHDIAKAAPEVAAELQRQYEAWHCEVVADGKLDGPSGVLRLPIPVGHTGARKVTLPATEAFMKSPSESLAYANGAGFAHDWMVGWNDEHNRMMWELDVAKASRFDVSVVGTFPDSSVGATLTVQSGESSVDAKITRAWHPDVTIRPDRSDAHRNRKVQNFVPVHLGAIELEPGQQTLELRARHDDGSLGIAVHSIRLEQISPFRNYPPKLTGARVETYKTVGDVELKTWSFEPDGHTADAARPAAVFFFGGGWRAGSPAQFHEHCKYLAARGMVAMTVEYRVSQRHETRAVDCIADAKSAIRWVRKNADRLGIDPKKILAGGGSAGGHLAACTGTLREFDAADEDASISSVPNAMALFNPALMLTTYKGRDPFDHERMYGMPARVGVDPQRASPVHHVRSGVPPTIIFHGRADDTVEYFTAEAFTNAMHDSGNRCELVGFDGETHGFFNFGRGDGTAYLKTIRLLDEFLVSLGYLNVQVEGDSGAQKPNAVLTEEQQIVKLVQDAQRAGFERHDFDAYISIWAPNAKLVAGRSRVKGKYDFAMDYEQIRATRAFRFSETPARGVKVEFLNARVKVDGDRAELAYQAKVAAEDGYLERVNEIYKLQKLDGVWKVIENRYWLAEIRTPDSVTTYGAETWKRLDAEVVEQARTGGFDGHVVALFDAFRFPEALKVCRSATKRDPQSANAWMMRGHAAIIAGHADEAFDSLQQALRIDPEYYVPPWAKVLDGLLKGATFYASFDESVAADFGSGGKKPSTRFDDVTKKGQYIFEPGVTGNILRIAKQQGVVGGALEGVDVLPRRGRVFFPAAGNIAYKPGGWGGAVSFWLNSNPNTQLKTKYCDPIQITHRGAHNGGLWVDFPNTTPRDFRLGVFRGLAADEKPVKESDPEAAIIRVPRIGFKQGRWHHVVMNWSDFDTGQSNATVELFIDGKSAGRLRNRDLPMKWDLERVGIYVGVAYIGLMDELAIFGRPLTSNEINALRHSPKVLSRLKVVAER